jgi:sigma-54 dependent transcriptional regulator, flagellar regulatory protein
MVSKVAASNASVLITGPSGSGKELVARAIHNGSARARQAFVPVNSGALPTELLESELFGHEKGAFTGAIAAKAGRFELAHRGTLFLDEIGDMPATMQVKLLRVLEDRIIERVGGTSGRRVDVRLISATHQDLGARIAAQQFREDLFYRLEVFHIFVPPLAERPADIEQLARHFLSSAGSIRQSPRLMASALARLRTHSWPGNVRELRNLIERATILYPGEALDNDAIDQLLTRRAILPCATPMTPICEETVSQFPHSLGDCGRVNLRDIIADLEKTYIRAALRECNGVVTSAASLLGLRRTTLVEKMRRMRIGG